LRDMPLSRQSGASRPDENRQPAIYGDQVEPEGWGQPNRVHERL